MTSNRPIWLADEVQFQTFEIREYWPDLSRIVPLQDIRSSPKIIQ